MPALSIQVRSLLAQHLPELVSKSTHLIPTSLQKFLINQVLQRVFQDALDAGEMNFMEGSFIRFEIIDCKLEWTYTVKARSLQLVDVQQADASIRCKLREFVLLATRQVDPDTLFFQRRLTIEGDTELGLTMKNLMDTIDSGELPLPLLKGLQMMQYLLDSN
jgi:predicted lipid carrier protein YhbT